MNGVEALRATEKDTFDAILMDIQMPEMDGIEATHAIRSDSRLRGLPVIAMTAHAMLGDEERFLRAGMNDYVAKPIDEADLLEVLSKWLPFEIEETASSETAAVFPESLPGINTVDGLKRVNGKADLFAKLVEDFREENESILNRLRRAIDEASSSEALEMAHSLKGASASIGATGVSATAAALEDALRTSMDCQVPLADLDRELSVVLEGVRASQKAASSKRSVSASAASAVDPSEAFPLLMELMQRLVDNNLEAGRSFKKVRDVVRDCGHDAELESLEASINQLDFDAAAAQLDELARALSLSLPKA